MDTGGKIRDHPSKSAFIRAQWCGGALVILFRRTTVDAMGFL